MLGKNCIKIIFIIFFLLICALNAAAQNVHVTVQVTNVTVNGGRVVGGIFLTADEFRRETPSIPFILESTATTVSCVLSVPPGEYVVTAFQDTNNNLQLDVGLFGIPREMVAVSNYNGRGSPLPSRDYNRQKISINSSTPVITIGLYRF